MKGVLSVGGMLMVDPAGVQNLTVDMTILTFGVIFRGLRAQFTFHLRPTFGVNENQRENQSSNFLRKRQV